MKLRYTSVLMIGMAVTCAVCAAQDHALAPRSAMLTGTADHESARGIYVITFPMPNNCVKIPPVRATSRGDALYRAVSMGGFSLKPSNAGLTVWTIEEWEEAEKSIGPEVLKQWADACKRESPEKVPPTPEKQ